MAKKLLRTLSILCALVMILSIPMTTFAEPMEPVTLKIIMRGEAPNDIDKVVAEAEKLMADTINVKLNLVWMPNSDISSMERVSLASGEPNDLLWHPGRTDMTTFVNMGALLELDELGEQSGLDGRLGGRRLGCGGCVGLQPGEDLLTLRGGEEGGDRSRGVGSFEAGGDDEV